jgi:hypothetical protein
VIALVYAPVEMMRRNAVAAAGTAAAVIVVTALLGDAMDYRASGLLVVGALSYACGAHARPAAGAAVLSASLLLTAAIPDDAWFPVVIARLARWLAGRAGRSRHEVEPSRLSRRPDFVVPH